MSPSISAPRARPTSRSERASSRPSVTWIAWTDSPNAVQRPLPLRKWGAPLLRRRVRLGVQSVQMDSPAPRRASASLREGLSEMFTINRLGLPPRLRKCLGSTNLIDSTHSGVRQKTRRVTHWKNGAMALRWAAASFVETEKSYRRIIGYHQLWMLRAHLDDHEPVAEMRKAG